MKLFSRYLGIYPEEAVHLINARPALGGFVSIRDPCETEWVPDRFSLSDREFWEQWLDHNYARDNIDRALSNLVITQCKETGEKVKMCNFVPMGMGSQLPVRDGIDSESDSREGSPPRRRNVSPNRGKRGHGEDEWHRHIFRQEKRCRYDDVLNQHYDNVSAHRHATRTRAAGEAPSPQENTPSIPIDRRSFTMAQDYEAMYPSCRDTRLQEVSESDDSDFERETEQKLVQSPDRLRDVLEFISRKNQELKEYHDVFDMTPEWMLTTTEDSEMHECPVPDELRRYTDDSWSRQVIMWNHRDHAHYMKKRRLCVKRQMRRWCRGIAYFVGNGYRVIRNMTDFERKQWRRVKQQEKEEDARSLDAAFSTTHWGVLEAALESISVSPKNEWWVKVTEHIGRAEGACPMDSERLSHLFLMSAIDGKPSTELEEVLRRCDNFTAEAMQRGLRPFVK